MVIAVVCFINETLANNNNTGNDDNDTTIYKAP